MGNIRGFFMARSLKVAPEYIEKVKQAVQRNSFPSQNALATELGISRDTVRKFLNGISIDYLNFVEISEKLGLDWQKIAFKEEIKPPPPSPFIIGAPITQPRYFFGRQYYLKRIFDLLKRHPLQNAAIIGKQRSGKTSLLHYLKSIITTPATQLRVNQKSDWLTHPDNYCWIFVDLQDARMQCREGFLGHILKCLEMPIPTPCNLEKFMDAVSGKVQKPTVILLDEIGVGLQRCPELDDAFWESLRSLATNHTQGNLAFVLATPESPIDLARHTGHTSPFFNIFGYSATLGALTELEARELIASSPIAFAEDDIKWILSQSGCWPILLQILCRERLFTLEDGEIGDNWREEGLQQIQPYVHLLEKPGG